MKGLRQIVPYGRHLPTLWAEHWVCVANNDTVKPYQWSPCETKSEQIKTIAPTTLHNDELEWLLDRTTNISVLYRRITRTADNSQGTLDAL